jgi:hypothetical protein
VVKRLSLTATLLAAFVLVVTQMAPAADPKPKLVLRTYAVADLVIPIAGTEKRGKAPATQEDRLIQTIEKNVVPASWASNGGWGTVEYFPPTMSLVVAQTPDGHEQVAEWLAKVRKRNEVEVALEMRFLTVTDETYQRLALKLDQPQRVEITSTIGEDGFERIGVDFEKKTGGEASGPNGAKLTFVNDKQLAQILERVSKDPKNAVLAAPKITMLNGQTGVLSIRSDGASAAGAELKADEKDGGLQIKALPIVSADRRFVKLRFNVEQFNATGIDSTVCIPDGGTVVFGGLKREPGASRCLQFPYVNRLYQTTPPMLTGLVMVTSRVLVVPDEEEKPAPAAAVKPAGYLAHSPQYIPTSSKDRAMTELLKAYDEACDAGRGDEADKLARAALILDPTCFRHKR